MGENLLVSGSCNPHPDLTWAPGKIEQWYLWHSVLKLGFWWYHHNPCFGAESTERVLENWKALFNYSEWEHSLQNYKEKRNRVEHYLMANEAMCDSVKKIEAYSKPGVYVQRLIIHKYQYYHCTLLKLVAGVVANDS